jgi:hypothetical protein
MYKLKKTILSSVALLIFVVMSSFRMPEPDAILGTWKEKDGTKTIEIYKLKTSYFVNIT